MQRIETGTSLCQLQGMAKIAGLLQVRDPLAQRLEEALSQPFPLLQDPILVVAGKQLAPIQVDRPRNQIRPFLTLLRSRGGLEAGLKFRPRPWRPR